jgi:tetratricopeptide (TPR) repeat protein
MGIREKTKLVLLVLVTFTTSVAAPFAGASSDFSPRQIKLCETPRVPLEEENDLDRLRHCHHVAYHFLADEWRVPVKYALRIVQLDPTDVSTRGTAIHYLYSQWVIWRGDAQRLPEGQYALDKALRLIELGKRNPINAKNPQFYLEMAGNLLPIANIYRPDLYPLLITLFEGLDQTSDDLVKRGISRRIIAVTYKKMGRLEEARLAFQRALELDPLDSLALEGLRNLND